ncbi:DUF5012 domain-containing protein [Niabella pedocola]|uniref:DUF5012 domain-containing protein n=1 Tax=Niabella pedocola TaxID=1752077 RepID=A0ABS8PXE7_9BACT|nr:BT_2262 family domain-containing protein [Niabella pedocola]MCD2425729.1 DUF5012 domain-containing protein [Niabella pedocola]
MNKILNITAFLFLCIVTATSCKKDSKGVSFVTTYAEVELDGAGTVFSQIGQPFTDPGYSAKEGDKDITSAVVVKSNIDITKAGIYSVSYAATNSDGFTSAATRTVVVCDKTAPLNGYYRSNIFRDNNGTTSSRGPYTVLVFGTGNDQYYVQDLLGRWYDVGSAYGAAYAGSGIVKLNGDNTFTLVSSNALGFGPTSAPKIETVSTYTPATKTIVLNTIMGDTPTMHFKVTLSNPQPLN